MRILKEASICIRKSLETEDSMYIDVHCHLDLLKNPESVISDAWKKRVRIIVGAGVDLKTNREALDFAENFKEVKAMLGIYPDECLKLSAREINSELNFIRKNADKIIGIGEVGMDFAGKKNLKDKQKQIWSFKKFIELSIELEKIIVVHSRKAEKECIDLLEELGAKRVVMHYFSGKLNLVERIIKNNWMLSIPTAVKNNEHFQKVIEIVCIDRLLCETDSPYSHPDKKFPNFPENVIESYKVIAKIKGLSLKDVEKKIEKNWINLVG